MNILRKLELYRASEIDKLIEQATNVSHIADEVIKVANTRTHAVTVLKEYCHEQEFCTECVFYNNECELAHTPPCLW